MGPKKSKTILRDIPPTTGLLQSDTAAQLSLEIADKDANGYMRDLPGNEILVMALNEIAADRGRGFFFYLPFREAWKKTDSLDLLPASRIPSAPGQVHPAS